jgi:hypothetical protein
VPRYEPIAALARSAWSAGSSSITSFTRPS